MARHWLRTVLITSTPCTVLSGQYMLITSPPMAGHYLISWPVLAWYFHLRALSRVLSLLTREAANAIAVCLILSKLDYCNSLLVGLPQTQIKRLQAVRNTAARFVMRQRKHDHITSTLKELHWLPVHDHILHKLLSVFYCSIHENLPLYLSELISPYTPSHSLQSASESFLAVPGPKDCKTKRYGQRTFRHIIPS